MRRSQSLSQIKYTARNLLFVLLTVGVAVILGEPNVGQSQPVEESTIWGNVNFYTDSHVVVDGKQYNFHRAVVIDTYSLKTDKRGNVRLMLASDGTVLQLFFHGIDMPEAIERYKK